MHLKGKETEKERDVVPFILAHSLNASDRLGWARTKPGDTWNSSWALLSCSGHHLLPPKHQQEAGIRSNPWH